MSQTYTLPSMPPLATVRPSGLAARLQTLDRSVDPGAVAVGGCRAAVAGRRRRVPAGIGLFLVAGRGKLQYAPDSWLLAITALAAVPAMAVAQRPVADTLRSTPI